MTFQEFWPTYLALHSRRETRVLHAMATASFGAWVVAAFVTRTPVLLLVAPVSDYLIAQASHRLFERNVTKPWLHPLLHARAEAKLFARTISSRL
jgi:hypothetical protein